MTRDADLRACLDDFHSVLTDDDAEILYTPAGGSQTGLPDAMFRSPDQPVVGDDLQFEGVGPTFFVHATDCPNLEAGDGFVRGGVSYLVTGTSKNEGFLWRAFCRVV